MNHLWKGYLFCASRVQNESKASANGAPIIRNGRTHVVQEMTMKQAELEKVHVEIVKLIAEQRKLNAEAGKMTRDTFWYPVAVAIGLIGTVATVTAVLIKLL